jgi:prepilin-type N-terminal cleavage/methylation domain-containing protein
MRNINNKAFTLVELLVVITILAIISVVAYQNFWWAVDKAVSGRKIWDVSTIETSLQQYKADKNYYPPTDILSPTNLWWYTWAETAYPSNTISVAYDGQEIDYLTWTIAWWWRVFWTWTWANTAKRQIWAKWTISINTLWKKYLSKDLYDPELWDIKITGSWKMIDYWIGRYVYATYKKNKTDITDGAGKDEWVQNYNWVNYNIAFTIRSDWSDQYETKIVWDYDQESCYDDKSFCPPSLIWSWTVVLIDGQKDIGSSDDNESWIPYYVTDFLAQ